MLKQMVIGVNEKPVKYHGLVKFVVFECNNCHKQFEKQESYFKKQMKTRDNACCFCSPRCRSLYLTKNNIIAHTYKSAVGKKKAEAPSVFSRILHKVFKS